METARPATLDDVARIAALARELRAELAEYRGGALWATRDVAGEPLEGHVTQLLARDDARVVVGCIDDVVVGFGAVLVEALRDGTRLGVVTDLYVEPEARSVGVGEAITGAVAAHCRDHECVGIDVVALPGHRATKNFFEEQGYTARAIVMHHSLEEPAPEEPAPEEPE
jgi:ribosomal protein S18 acetylase RimI-like enzyme